MSTDTLEASVHDSQPVELYQFLGSYKNYYLTSDAEPFVFQGVTYIPIAGLVRTSIKAGTHAESNTTLKVTLPVANDIIADYAFQVTPPSLKLNLFRVYRGLTPPESNYKLYWNGPITNINVAGNKATMDIPSIFSNALGGSCPSVYFQTPCNHVLFDALTCKVPRAANSVDTMVAEVLSGGMVVRLATLGAFPAIEYVGGELFVGTQNERRMIIGGDNSTGLLTVNYPFGRLAPGTAIQGTRGCNHAWKGDCKNRYNNTVNFGGHPLIPALNIFETGF
jgi:hypothetical protein